MVLGCHRALADRKERCLRRMGPPQRSWARETGRRVSVGAGAFSRAFGNTAQAAHPGRPQGRPAHTLGAPGVSEARPGWRRVPGVSRGHLRCPPVRSTWGRDGQGGRPVLHVGPPAGLTPQEGFDTERWSGIHPPQALNAGLCPCKRGAWGGIAPKRSPVTAAAAAASGLLASRTGDSPLFSAFVEVSTWQVGPRSPGGTRGLGVVALLT